MSDTNEQDFDKIYDFFAKIVRLGWYALFGYLVFVLISPSMFFWESLGGILSMLLVDIPNNIFEYFYAFSEHVSGLYVYGDSSTTWAQVTGGFLALVSFGIALGYYLLLLSIFLTSIGYDGTSVNPGLENEIDWLMGIGTTEDHKQAQIQAKAIAAELNRNK